MAKEILDVLLKEADGLAVFGVDCDCMSACFVFFSFSGAHVKDKEHFWLLWKIWEKEKRREAADWNISKMQGREEGCDINIISSQP